MATKTVKTKSWEEITRPIRVAAKKAGITEADVDKMIQKVRKSKSDAKFLKSFLRSLEDIKHGRVKEWK